ncbi:MAG: hypothetical protein WAX14_08390 [Rhodococcus sp. (in: high G+C Gram-positive bacteria)]|uniref:hypothetical protein n=1 Tax=Rhodococcus sp. TaxID=1831 RepID=UPI003BB4D875
MNTTPIRAENLTVGDTIDLSPALDWLRNHADGPVDAIAIAIDLASCDYAVVTALDVERHSRTGEPVVVISNTIVDIAVPAALEFNRITA